MDGPDENFGSSDPLERQRQLIEESFVTGWVTPARGPTVLSADDLTQVARVRSHGGWLNSQQLEYVRQLEAGGRLGDPLPAAPEKRKPFIEDVGDDFEVRITDQEEDAAVVILFSHARWPGVRFAHRFAPPVPFDYPDIGLMEEIETGALDRQMRTDPQPDPDGLTWTDWSWRSPDAR